MHRQQLENAFFICTDHALSAMQMLPSIVDDLFLLKNGVVIKLPSGEPVLVIAPMQFITADNTRHAELASSLGARSNRPCRKCNWFVKTPATPGGEDNISPARSEDVVGEMFNTYLTTDDPKTLVDSHRGYKLVGGQCLLRLKSFGTMVDCPIELLHSIMLGVGKKLIKDQLLGQHLSPTHKALLQSALFNHNSAPFSPVYKCIFQLYNKL